MMLRRLRLLWVLPSVCCRLRRRLGLLSLLRSWRVMLRRLRLPRRRSLRLILRLLVMLRLWPGVVRSRLRVVRSWRVMLRLLRRVRLSWRRMGRFPLSLGRRMRVTRPLGLRRMLLRLPLPLMVPLLLRPCPLLLLPVQRRMLRRRLLLLRSLRVWLLLPRRMRLMVCGRNCLGL
jgi:hypothetical protein